MAKSICVFAGSSIGTDPEFARAAADLGRALVARSYGLVYGGAKVGLMGILADAVLAANGHVIGVIPDFLVGKEIAHAGVSELKVVRSMHERKDTMARLSDGFIALPGGFGTLEEFFETLTWAQLGLHAKPCGLLNIGGYYDDMLRFVETAIAHRLVKPEYRAMLIADNNAAALLDRFEAYTAPAVTKWFDEELT